MVWPCRVFFVMAVMWITDCVAFQPTSTVTEAWIPLRGITSAGVGMKFGKAKSTAVVKSSERDDFWSQQRELMQEMTGRAEKSLKEEQREKFASRRNALVADTAIFTTLIFSLLWVISVNPFVSFSYALGAAFGLAYAYGLGKYVETLGGSVDDAGEIQGAGIGQARFAFLILLFLFVGKFRSQGLIEIPSIAGFFTYQLASLSQGLREIND